MDVVAFVDTAQELDIDMSPEALKSLGEWLPRDALAIFRAYVGPGDADDTEDLRIVCDGGELEWFDAEFNGWTIFFDETGAHPALGQFVAELNRVLRRG